MNVQVIHSRDPDSACGIEVYIDGELVEHEENSFDPGAGYQWSDGWGQDLVAARDAALGGLTNAYLRAVFEGHLDATQSQYVEGKPDDWQRRIEDPEYTGNDDAYEKARPWKVHGTEAWRIEPVAHCKTREEAEEFVSTADAPERLAIKDPEEE